MMLRVRRAASTSMRARSSTAGRTKVRSASSADQVTSTPMLCKTSSSRLTSSMCAIPRSTVRPLFNRLAQSSATAAFLDERVSIEPDKEVSPSILRFIEARPPGTIKGDSSAFAIRLIISSDRFWLPDSMRWIALWLVLRRLASSFWVRPRCLRASLTKRPMLAGDVV